MKHVNPEALIGALDLSGGNRAVEVKGADEAPDQIVTKALENLQASIDQRIAEIVAKQADTAKLVERLDRVEAKANRPVADITADRPNVERKAFMSFVRRGIDRIPDEERKALTVSVDANGGYLAPETFGSEILKKLVEFSPIRQYAKVTTITSSEVKYPRRLTGTAAAWVAEIGTRTETGQTYEQATFTPHEASVFVPVSLQLLEDNAYGLEAELYADFAESFGKLEATAFVSGDGTGKPRGLLTATGIAEVKTGHASTLGTDPAATLIGMFHALPNVFAQNGVWLMNRTVLGTLRGLKDGDGRFILADPISATMPMTLLGRPIVEAVDMPNVAANANPIMFGDLAGYRIVDRLGLSIQRDPFTLSDVGQVKFTARRRVGGDVSHVDHFVKLKVTV